MPGVFVGTDVGAAEACDNGGGVDVSDCSVPGTSGLDTDMRIEKAKVNNESTSEIIRTFFIVSPIPSQSGGTYSQEKSMIFEENGRRRFWRPNRFLPRVKSIFHVIPPRKR